MRHVRIGEFLAVSSRKDAELAIIGPSQSTACTRHANTVSEEIAQNWSICRQVLSAYSSLQPEIFGIDL